MPKAAMIAPPGTPGAATIIIPNMKMNPPMTDRSIECPVIYNSAIEHATIFNVLPARWIVAHNGTVKTAIFSRTPFFSVDAKVTGIVAAEDEVPSAVA